MGCSSLSFFCWPALSLVRLHFVCWKNGMYWRETSWRLSRGTGKAKGDRAHAEDWSYQVWKRGQASSSWRGSIWKVNFGEANENYIFGGFLWRRAKSLSRNCQCKYIHCCQRFVARGPPRRASTPTAVWGFVSKIFPRFIARLLNFFVQAISRKAWISDPHEKVTKEVAADIKTLWQDPAFKEVYDTELIPIEDSTPYFFEDSNLDRISSADYIPTTDDVLRVRVKTTGISEITFTIADVNFRMVDVGGQRSERRKWIHCFQDVTAVIFFVAMSEYNQFLIEDASVNRMHESIALFDEIVNSRWFEKSSIILFLNKSDLFKEKIQKVDLKVLFEDYNGNLISPLIFFYDLTFEFLRIIFF